MSQTMLVFSKILTASDNPSLIEEIWTYIVDKYFTIDWYSYSYSHIPVTDGGLISIRTGIAGILLGVIIAAALSIFQKRTLGDMVRAIDREWCVTPESAKTLTELGLIRNTAIKGDLRHGHSLRRVVRCVEQEAHDAAQQSKRDELVAGAEAGDADAIRALKKWKEVPYRFNFETDHFYIPEKLIYGADVHFDKKGTTPLSLIWGTVLCVVALALICFFLPELLQLTDNLISSLL
jgi:hypothetical protein